MSYAESAMDRQYEAWMEQEREWYDHCVQMEHEGWHVVKFRYEDHEAVYAWLLERYGKADAYAFNDEALVKTEKDKTWFQIKWSQ